MEDQQPPDASGLCFRQPTPDLVRLSNKSPPQNTWLSIGIQNRIEAGTAYGSEDTDQDNTMAVEAEILYPLSIPVSTLVLYDEDLAQPVI